MGKYYEKLKEYLLNEKSNDNNKNKKENDKKEEMIFREPSEKEINN